MATNDVVQIVRSGTVVVDLLRGPVRLRQDSWSPVVASLRDSALGNQSIYEDVEEDMVLQVVATGADDPGATLATIQRMCEMGRRWNMGDPGIGAFPPRLRVRPAGSRLGVGAYYQATIIGGGLKDIGESYTRMLEANGVADIPITIKRHGGWALSTGISASAGPSAPQTIHVVTLSPARDEWAPASLAIVPAAVVNALGDPGVTGVILVAPNETGALDAYDWVYSAPSGAYSNQASTEARGASYVRWAPASATTGGTEAVTIVPFDTATPYATMRVTSGGPFQVRARFLSSTFDEPLAILYSEWITVSGSNAQVIAFRPVSSWRTHDRASLELKSLAAGTIELDTLVIHREGMVGAHAIRLVEGAFLVGNSAPSKYTVATIWNDPSQDAVAFPTPVVGQYPTATPFDPTSPSSTAADRIMGYLGDAAVHVASSGVRVMSLLVESTNFTPMAGASQCNLTVQVKRRDMSTTLG